MHTRIAEALPVTMVDITAQLAAGIRKLLPEMRTIPWYGQRHATRIVRWLSTRPPRVQTMRSVLDALAAGRQTDAV